MDDTPRKKGSGFVSTESPRWPWARRFWSFLLWPKAAVIRRGPTGGIPHTAGPKVKGWGAEGGSGLLPPPPQAETLLFHLGFPSSYCV